MQRFYLDELASLGDNPTILGLLQLIVKPEKQVPALARELWTQVDQAQAPNLSQAAMLGLIETILVYKFPQMSRQEIGVMLGLAESATQTRVYQEGVEDGIEKDKRTIALRMVKEEMELDLIARMTDLTIDQIKDLQSGMEG